MGLNQQQRWCVGALAIALITISLPSDAHAAPVTSTEIDSNRHQGGLETNASQHNAMDEVAANIAAELHRIHDARVNARRQHQNEKKEPVPSVAGNSSPLFAKNSEDIRPMSGNGQNSRNSFAQGSAVRTSQTNRPSSDQQKPQNGGNNDSSPGGKQAVASMEPLSKNSETTGFSQNQQGIDASLLSSAQAQLRHLAERTASVIMPKESGPEDLRLERPRQVSVATAKEGKEEDVLSPGTLAEYIMATGDEETVADAVEGLLKDGLLSREEAIKYLRDVKGDLDTMRTEAAMKRIIKEDTAGLILRSSQQQGNVPAYQVPPSRPNILLGDDLADNDLDAEHTRRDFLAGNPMKSAAAAAAVPQRHSSLEDDLSEVEFSELVERLKFVDLIYTEYGLEDVLYKLAKLMFDDSLAHDVGTPDSILSKLNAYLASEEKEGRLTPDLTKRIQEVLVSSLFDALQEDALGKIAGASATTSHST